MGNTAIKKGQKVYLLPLFLKGNTVPDVDKALVVVCGKTITADYKGHEFKFDKETHLDMDPYGPRFKLFLTLNGWPPHTAGRSSRTTSKNSSRKSFSRQLMNLAL